MAAKAATQAGCRFSVTLGAAQLLICRLGLLGWPPSRPWRHAWWCMYDGALWSTTVAIIMRSIL